MLISKTHVKRFTLDTAHRLRPGTKFTRVSAELYDSLEALVRRHIIDVVNRSPSLGKTIYPLIRVAKVKEGDESNVM